MGDQAEGVSLWAQLQLLYGGGRDSGRSARASFKDAYARLRQQIPFRPFRHPRVEMAIQFTRSGDDRRRPPFAGQGFSEVGTALPEPGQMGWEADCLR